MKKLLLGILLVLCVLGVTVARSQTSLPYNAPRVYGAFDTAAPPSTTQLDRFHRQGAILVVIIPLPDGAGYRTYLRYESR